MADRTETNEERVLRKAQEELAEARARLTATKKALESRERDLHTAVERGGQLDQEVQNLKMALGQLQGLVSSTSRQNSELLETVKRLAMMGSALLPREDTAKMPKLP